MRIFFSYFSLSDRYERKAGLLPGLLLAAVPALTAAVVLPQFTEWYVAAQRRDRRRVPGGNRPGTIRPRPGAKP